MTKKPRVVAGVLTALVAGLALWWGASRSDEPRYKGKTVSEWLTTPEETKYAPPEMRTRPSGLRVLVGRQSSELPSNPGIRAMLDALGSNAVPALVQHLRESRSIRVQVYSKLAATPSLPTWVNNFAASNLVAPIAMILRAGSALRYLGPDATSAIPELEQLAMDSHPVGRFTAVSTLAGLGIDGWRAMGHILTNASPANAASLQGLVAVVAGQALQRGNLRLRQEAALTLCHLDSPPFTAIPVLSDIIDAGDSARAIRALGGLTKLATNHVAARDVIRRAARSENPEIRGLAQSILDRTGYTNTIAKQ